MINDDFDFTLDSSDFPVSIEEFAAYLDGNLTDDETQRVGHIIDNNEVMQEIMDSMELSELTLARNRQEDVQLPEELSDKHLCIPNIDNHFVGGISFNPIDVAACFASPMFFNQTFMMDDLLEDISSYFDEGDDSEDNEADIPSDMNEDNPINK